jgi:hypothetical protein
MRKSGTVFANGEKAEKKERKERDSMVVPAVVMFCCAAVMGYMGVRRYRAGERGRAMLNFFMAAAMFIFGAGYL